MGISLFLALGLLSNFSFYQSSISPSSFLDSKLKSQSHNDNTNSSPFSSTNVPERQLLPQNVKPLNYNLTLDPNFETFKFGGDLAIRYVYLYLYFIIFYFFFFFHN